MDADRSLVGLDGSGSKMQADIELCGKVYAELEKHYPGHHWAVGCDHEQGTVAIKLMYFVQGFHGEPGFLIKISMLNSQGGWAKVMMAGGELLERFGLERRGMRAGDREIAAAHGLIKDGII